MLAGLEPAVAFPPVRYSREGVALFVEDGHLNAEYAAKLDEDTMFNLRVDDEKAWDAGVAGRFGLRRQLPRGAALTYTVENPVGVYDLGKSTHIGRLSAPVAGGEAALRVEGDASAQAYEGSYRRGLAGGQADLRLSHKGGALGYNVSYARGLGEALPVDAAAQVGVDEEGAYTRLTADRS